MRSYPRIRKTIKWGGAAVTVLLVVVWYWSGEYGTRFQCDQCSIDVYRGILAVDIGKQVTSHRPGWSVWASEKSGWDWGHEYRWDEWSMLEALPLWVLTTLAVFATSMAWHFDTLARRRAKSGLILCATCGYDRTGILQDAKCPECGAGPASVDA